MATSVSLNGTTYSIPATGESGWGTNVSSYLVALSTGVLSKAGGTFTLLADTDFGTGFGLKSIYYKSRGVAASTGVFRLASAETLAWRNNANSADLPLTTDTSDNLLYNGNPILTLALGSAYTVLQMNAGGTAFSWAAPTGTGSPVLASSPTLVTPVLGVAAATSINKMSITTPASGSTLAVADGKTATISNTLTFIGTDGQSMTFPNGSSTVMTLASADAITGAKTFAQTTLKLQDNSTHAVTVSTTNSTTSYTIKLPASQGAASTVLTNDGSGNLTWGSTVSTSLNQYFIYVGDSSNAAQAVNTNLLGDAQSSYQSQAATFSNATPTVVTQTSHGLSSGSKVYFTGGSLPTGVSASTIYYVTVVSSSTYKLSSSITNYLAGTFVATTSTGSGTALTGGIVLNSNTIGSRTINGTSLTVATNVSSGSSSMLKLTNNANSQTLSISSGSADTSPTINVNTDDDIAIQSNGNTKLTIKGQATTGVQIKGVTDGSSASAGNVGEIQSNIGFGGSVTIAASVTELGHLTVTAGSYKVTAHIAAAASQAATNHMTWGVGTTTASYTGTTLGSTKKVFSCPTGSASGSDTITFNVDISSSTTYYLNATSDQGTGLANGNFLGSLFFERLR